MFKHSTKPNAKKIIKQTKKQKAGVKLINFEMKVVTLITCDVKILSWLDFKNSSCFSFKKKKRIAHVCLCLYEIEEKRFN